MTMGRDWSIQRVEVSARSTLVHTRVILATRGFSMCCSVQCATKKTKSTSMTWRASYIFLWHLSRINDSSRPWTWTSTNLKSMTSERCQINFAIRSGACVIGQMKRTIWWISSLRGEQTLRLKHVSGPRWTCRCWWLNLRVIHDS